mgnify:CR=1 FL=1
MRPDTPYQRRDAHISKMVINNQLNILISNQFNIRRSSQSIQVW